MSSSLISSPQLVSAAAFTPQKGFVASAFLVGDGGAPSQQLVLEELPVKPFFFAAVDLIEHFLSMREETTASPVFPTAAPGESRPGGLGAGKDSI